MLKPKKVSAIAGEPQKSALPIAAALTAIQDISPAGVIVAIKTAHFRAAQSACTGAWHGLRLVPP